MCVIDDADVTGGAASRAESLTTDGLSFISVYTDNKDESEMLSAGSKDSEAQVCTSLAEKSSQVTVPRRNSCIVTIAKPVAPIDFPFQMVWNPPFLF